MAPCYSVVLLFASFLLCVDSSKLELVNSLHSGNITEFLEWSCWTHSASRIKPADWEDCRGIAEGILALEPHGRPWILGTRDVPEVDYVIPMSLTRDSCKIRILPLPIRTGPHVQDTFTARYLSHQVHRMNQMCVLPPPHIGGEGGIGSKDVIALAVAGLIAPKPSRRNGRLVIEQGLDYHAAAHQ